MSQANLSVHPRRALEVGVTSCCVKITTGVSIAFLVAASVGFGQQVPIQLDTRNPHYFNYDGNTIFLLTSGEHYGAVINPDFDFNKYLATLQADALNYTRLFTGSYVESPAKSFGIVRNDLAPAPGRFLAPWARSDVPGYAGGGNKFDLSRWNPEYFRRLYEFLSAAERRGIIVEVTFFSSQYGEVQWDLSPFNGDNNVNSTDAIDWRKVNTLENGNILVFQERYVRKLVSEIKTFPNVIFEIANEPWSDRPVTVDVVNQYLPEPMRDKYPNSIDVADNSTAAWEQRVARWIAEEESSVAHAHLVAQNYCNFWFPVKQLVPGVSVVNFHYAYPEAVTLNYGLQKALSYDESGFLGRGDEAYIRQAWNFMLSGGSAFDGLDYTFTVGHEDGMDLQPNGPGGGGPVLRKSLKALRDFLIQFPIADLRPDREVVEHADGVYLRALGTGRGQYVMYLDGKGPAKLRLRLARGAYRVKWEDPRTGNTVSETTLQASEPATSVDSPPFGNGLALSLERTR